MVNRTCVFNEGVDCDPRTLKCLSCGWNPVVSKARIAKLTETEVEAAETADTSGEKTNGNQQI